MKSKMLLRSALLATTVLSMGHLSVIPAAAQSTSTIVQNLYENQAYIRSCRQTNTTVQVFDNTSLGPTTNRIGTLPAGAQVRLTGVLTSGRAQIYLADGTLSSVQPVGWINAANLTNCGSTPPPVTRACFRTDFPLNVRAEPRSTSTLVANYNAGDTVYSTTNPPTQQTSPNTAPDYGRVWMEVSIFNNREGWISRTGPYGQGSNVTPINCP